MSFRHLRWDEMETEQLKPGLTRAMAHTGQVTVARVFLAKGALVPEHSHPNEQVTVILGGALQFRFGEEIIVVRPGEVLLIPAHLPHEAIALEDTWDLDVFNPVREDWVNKTDAYLRGAR